MAVGVGFEPTVRRQAYNGFRDRRFQPLSHPTMVVILSGRSSRIRTRNLLVRSQMLSSIELRAGN